MEIMNVNESSIFYLYLAQLNQLIGEGENSEEILKEYLKKELVDKIDDKELKIEI